jgi:hypothetical protein
MTMTVIPALKEEALVGRWQFEANVDDIVRLS